MPENSPGSLSQVPSHAAGQIGHALESASSASAADERARDRTSSTARGPTVTVLIAPLQKLEEERAEACLPSY